MELPDKYFLVLYFDPPPPPSKELLLILPHLVRVSYDINGKTYNYTTGGEEDAGNLVAYGPCFLETRPIPQEDLFAWIARQPGEAKSVEIELLCPTLDFIDELVPKFNARHLIKTRTDWSQAVDLIASRTKLVRVLESVNILSSSRKSFMISEQHPSELFTYEDGWSEPLEVDFLDLPGSNDIQKVLKEIFRTTDPDAKC